MKFTLNGKLSDEERYAVGVVLRESGNILSGDGIPVTVRSFETAEELKKSARVRLPIAGAGPSGEDSENGTNDRNLNTGVSEGKEAEIKNAVHVKGFGNLNCVLEYCGRSALIRGISLLLRYIPKGEPFDVTEEAAFETLGTMVDVSRNAVLKPTEVKRLIRLTALLGFNAMMLYTEDTYEVPEEPYFGHLRGRYTKEELKDIDAYAKMFGVEMIPCIQTLAHLENMLKWPVYSDLRDWDNILNTADDRIYTLIEHFVKTSAECFRSRKIDIGMDEAYMLGRGRYMDEKGLRDSADIMKEHLTKVVAICDKYGFKPRMWSDMFFRMCTDDHQYYSESCNVTEKVKAAVPPEITLIYWDYYGAERGRYDRMMKNHLKFNNNVAFAGGTSSWYGLVPLNAMSVNFARAAMESARDHGMKEIYVTMWGDNGGNCSQFTTLPTLVCYGENNWNGNISDENLREALLAETGCDFDSFRDFERLTDVYHKDDYGFNGMNPTRFMLFQDVLQGKYDAHIPAGAGEFFAAQKERLEKEKAVHKGNFSYIYDSFIALADALSVKAELGVLLKKAYDKKDRSELKKIHDQMLPLAIEKTEALHQTLRTQWMRENKAFGFEVQDIRFGGLSARLQAARQMLSEYLEGRVESIEELEAPRLPLNPAVTDGTPGGAYAANNWPGIVSASGL